MKQKNTTPELLVKKALRCVGIRYRSGHGKHKPNSADILLPERRYALFINGCFWHGHEGCKRATIPVTRKDYWLNKIAKNISRDERAVEAFRSRGWAPMIIWECEVRNPTRLASIIGRLNHDRRPGI